MDKSCRHCDWGRETLPHVLNHCQSNLHKGTHRHNLIVTRVKNAASRKWNILYENQELMGTRLKPDLVLEKNDHLLILDITCPFDDGIETLKKARRDKILKYQLLVDLLSTKYKTVAVDAIVVGSLGSWDPRNDRTMLSLCT